MKRILISKQTNGNPLRYGMLIPLALIIASFVSGCLSYSNAKRAITDDLNDAMIALVNENSRLWTRQDTIAALRKMHETIHKPVIYQASEVKFRNAALRDKAYIALALVDRKNAAPKIRGKEIVSDSIMLVPEQAVNGLAIQVQGFADCSMASVFAASDQTLPGCLLALSILSMTSMLVWIRKGTEPSQPEEAPAMSAASLIEGIKLSPMQRQLTRMLLDAPGQKVDKTTLCTTLWGNKINAEESLYTLVKRTKTALACSNVEIVCNRGDSYELRVNI